MAVIIFILKIIEIIFLILGIILLTALLLVGIVLILPIKYNVFADKGKDNLKAKFSITVLKFLFNFTFALQDKKMGVRLKIFGKKIFSFQEDFESESENKEKFKGFRVLGKKFLSKEKKEKNPDKIKKTKLFGKSKKSKKVENPQEKKTSAIKFFKEYPDKMKILKSIIKCGKKIFKTIFPKEHSLNLIIGFEDPSKTGVNLGRIWAIKSIFGLNIVAKGNFEEKAFEGKVTLNGKFNLISLIIPVISLAFTIIKIELKRRGFGIKSIWKKIISKFKRKNKNLKMGMV